MALVESAFSISETCIQLCAAEYQIYITTPVIKENEIQSVYILVIQN